MLFVVVYALGLGIHSTSGTRHWDKFSKLYHCWEVMLWQLWETLGGWGWIKSHMGRLVVERRIYRTMQERSCTNRLKWPKSVLATLTFSWLVTCVQQQVNEPQSNASLSVIVWPRFTSSSQQLICARFFSTQWVQTFVIRASFSIFMVDPFTIGWTSWQSLSLWKTSTRSLQMETLCLLRGGKSALYCPGFCWLLRTSVWKKKLMVLSLFQQHLMHCLIRCWQ